MNLIEISFCIIVFNIVIVGAIVYFYKNHLPVFLRQSFCYGKFAETMQNPFISKLEIPKRWYQHFYLLSAPLSAYSLYLMVTKYFFNQKTPEYIYSVLDSILGKDRKLMVSPSNALLAMCLLNIQCSKRLYETQFVNVFSDAKMNIIHYFFGIYHYIGIIVAILGESEGFIEGVETNFKNTLNIRDWTCAFIFLCLSYQQLRSNFILSSLRKDEKGVVVTKEYKIPTGGLFDYISSPLQFCEIGMYTALYIILRDSHSYLFIYLWVVTNQIGCAFFSHQWHKNNFKNYPPSRKVIIPYLL